MKKLLREIVFDTETTGLDETTDRVIEIGCIELMNHVPTNKTFHVYINPEREVPENVIKVHGITSDFLKDKPKFSEIADDFLNFIKDSKLVAHNASFDIKFINSELKRIGKEELNWDLVIDTLQLSRKKNKTLSRHNLDSLCRYYNIDNSHRDLHGALLDANLLVEVYIELLGGKTIDLFKTEDSEFDDEDLLKKIKRDKIYPIRNFTIPQEEIEAHKKMLEKEIKNSIWDKYSKPKQE